MTGAGVGAAGSKSPLRILVFHRAVGFVHHSIPHSVKVIAALGEQDGWNVSASDDPQQFSDPTLCAIDVVVLLQTSGDVLPDVQQRAAFERFVQRGGGVFAVHAASSMGALAQEWPWFHDLIGAAFKGHTSACCYADAPVDEQRGFKYGGPLSSAPPDAERIGDAFAMTTWETATVSVEQTDSPAIGLLRDGEERPDEWYGFVTNPRGQVTIVATVDESTYNPGLGVMGDDHPIVWWHDFDGGRCVYNSMGHAVSTWDDPVFQSTIVGGINLAARRSP